MFRFADMITTLKHSPIPIELEENTNKSQPGVQGQGVGLDSCLVDLILRQVFRHLAWWWWSVDVISGATVIKAAQSRHGPAAAAMLSGSIGRRSFLS